MRENEAMAVLVSAAGVSYGRRELALREAGSALTLLEDPAAFSRILGAQGISAVRRALDKAPRMLDALEKGGVHLITQDMAQYPQRLMHTARPPHLLFCRGYADLNDPCPLAVVGTRRADAYGIRNTREISRDLAAQGVCIVSGLALGVDAAAHQGALEASGRTVAVLGSALDKMYPAGNRWLMEEILENGGSVVSEYAPGTAPTRYSFLQRNRIIAGMTLGVLVTRAPLRSGAKSTANCALEEGREVFALPGDIGREGSQLPNRLIAEGAQLITCAQDILDHVVEENIETPKVQKRRHASAAGDRVKSEKPEQAAPPMQGAEKAVYDALESGELDFDALCERTGVASDELGAVLMMMELDGVIESLPGLRYARL